MTEIELRDLAAEAAYRELRALAAELRNLSDEAAEAEYRELRDKLREDYQHIAGSQGRNRAREIAKLRGGNALPIGGGRPHDYDAAWHRGTKADRLEEQLESDNAEYDAGVTRKSMLAVRTGRLIASGAGRLEFRGTALTETIY